MLYSTFTAYLGFAVNEGEYKVMGLAAYGRPTMADAVRKLMPRTADGAFRLDLDYFDFHTTAKRSFSDKFVDLFGPPREPLRSDRPRHRRTAAASPTAPPACSSCWRTSWSTSPATLHRETGLPDLCLGGGVALNGVANARILRESGFERLFVPPAPGDAGCALGAALYADRIHFGNPDRDFPDHPFWGPAVDAARARPARAGRRPAGRGARTTRP